MRKGKLNQVREQNRNKMTRSWTLEKVHVIFLPFEKLFLLNREEEGQKKQQLRVDKSMRGEQRNCGTWRGRARVGQGHIRTTVNVCAWVCDRLNLLWHVHKVSGSKVTPVTHLGIERWGRWWEGAGLSRWMVSWPLRYSPALNALPFTPSWLKKGREERGTEANYMVRGK